jgi:hypothetical protein
MHLLVVTGLQLAPQLVQEQKQQAPQLVQEAELLAPQQLVQEAPQQLGLPVLLHLLHQLQLNVRQPELLNQLEHRLKELFQLQVKEFRYQLCQLKLLAALHLLRSNRQRPLTNV